MQVVLASRNAGKLKEMQALLAPLGVNLVSQVELDIESAPETGATFIENALQKARFVAERTGLPAIADDSGIVVPALGGEPGIYSARYAGTNAADLANNQLLLQRLSALESATPTAADPRAAYFFCGLVFLRHAADPTPILATASWHGTVIETPRGSNGFGYDPHFVPLGLEVTSAELAPDEKTD